MNAQHHELYSPAIGAAGTVVVLRPLRARGGRLPVRGRQGLRLAGQRHDRRDRDLIDGGRVKLYCVDSFDAASWSNQSVPLEERARAHGRYESWILDEVVPFIQHDTGGEIITGGRLGAFHAANFALKRADLFPLAICMSGNYDPSTWNGWGERGEQRTSTIRSTTSPSSAATTWTGCARGSACCWSAARGSGRTRRARCESTRSPACSPEGHPPRARPVGLRRPARLAILARPARPPSPEVLLMYSHLIGLLLGTEEDWPRAFETLLARVGPVTSDGTTHHVRASGSRSSRSTCATSRATTSWSTGWRGGTSSRASGSRRSR